MNPVCSVEPLEFPLARLLPGSRCRGWRQGRGPRWKQELRRRGPGRRHAPHSESSGRRSPRLHYSASPVWTPIRTQIGGEPSENALLISGVQSSERATARRALEKADDRSVALVYLDDGPAVLGGRLFDHDVAGGRDRAMHSHPRESRTVESTMSVKQWSPSIGVERSSEVGFLALDSLFELFDRHRQRSAQHNGVGLRNDQCTRTIFHSPCSRWRQ